MIAFKDLKDILDITISWESKLKDFYDVAELALKSDESKRVVAVLRNKVREKLEILRNMDLNKLGSLECVRYASGLKREDLIPKGAIGRNSSADEIFRHILNYEQKLKMFYSEVSTKLVSRNQKELFESLAVFKDEQISEINNYMAALSG